MLYILIFFVLLPNAVTPHTSFDEIPTVRVDVKSYKRTAALIEEVRKLEERLNGEQTKFPLPVLRDLLMGRRDNMEFIQHLFDYNQWKAEDTASVSRISDWIVNVNHKGTTPSTTYKWNAKKKVVREDNKEGARVRYIANPEVINDFNMNRTTTTNKGKNTFRRGINKINRGPLFKNLYSPVPIEHFFRRSGNEDPRKMIAVTHFDGYGMGRDKLHSDLTLLNLEDMNKDVVDAQSKKYDNYVRENEDTDDEEEGEDETELKNDWHPKGYEQVTVDYGRPDIVEPRGSYNERNEESQQMKAVDDEDRHHWDARGRNGQIEAWKGKGGEGRGDNGKPNENWDHKVDNEGRPKENWNQQNKQPGGANEEFQDNNKYEVDNNDKYNANDQRHRNINWVKPRNKIGIQTTVPDRNSNIYEKPKEGWVEHNLPKNNYDPPPKTNNREHAKQDRFIIHQREDELPLERNDFNVKKYRNKNVRDPIRGSHGPINNNWGKQERLRNDRYETRNRHKKEFPKPKKTENWSQENKNDDWSHKSEEAEEHTTSKSDKYQEINEDWNKQVFTKHYIWGKPSHEEEDEEESKKSDWDKEQEPKNNEWDKEHKNNEWDKPKPPKDKRNKPYNKDEWDEPHKKDEWDEPHKKNEWDEPHKKNEWDEPHKKDDWDEPHKKDEWDKSHKKDDWSRPNDNDNWHKQNVDDDGDRTRSKINEDGDKPDKNNWRKPKREDWDRRNKKVLLERNIKRDLWDTKDNYERTNKKIDWNKPPSKKLDWDKPTKVGDWDKPTKKDDWDKPTKKDDWDKPTKRDDWDKPTKKDRDRLSKPDEPHERKKTFTNVVRHEDDKPKKALTNKEDFPVHNNNNNMHHEGNSNSNSNNNNNMHYEGSSNNNKKKEKFSDYDYGKPKPKKTSPKWDFDTPPIKKKQHRDYDYDRPVRNVHRQGAPEGIGTPIPYRGKKTVYEDVDK